DLGVHADLALAVARLDGERDDSADRQRAVGLQEDAVQADVPRRAERRAQPARRYDEPHGHPLDASTVLTRTWPHNSCHPRPPLMCRVVSHAHLRAYDWTGPSPLAPWG